MIRDWLSVLRWWWDPSHDPTLPSNNPELGWVDRARARDYERATRMDGRWRGSR